jgi:hypothetical protein
MRPDPISPWQFAHTRTHFFTSARRASIPFPLPMLSSNDFVEGSTWWKQSR